MAIIVKEQTSASVSTPAVGSGTLFIDSADDKLKRKDSSGSVVNIEAVASGVSTFEGRSGAVVSASGDYTASEITNVPAGNLSSITVQAALNELDSEKAPFTHVGANGVSEHALATGAAAGFLSPSDFTKLGTVSSGATANSSDAFLLARANHTGTQLSGTVSDFNEAAQDAVGTILQDTATIDFTYDDTLNTIAADLKDASVSSAKLINDSVITSKILDANVTNAKIASGVDAVKIGSGNVSNTEFEYLDGVTSALQTQIDGKASTASVAAKVNKAGDSMSGALTLTDAAGQGFVDFAPQSVTPSAPASGVRLYSGATGRVAWKGSAGNAAALDATAITGTRIFTLPDASGTLMFDPMTTNGDLIIRSGGVASRLGIGSTDQVLTVSSGAATWADPNTKVLFGCASDGNITISGVTTLTQDAFYNIVTMSAGGAINLGGYRLFCRKLDLTNADANSIRRNGNPGSGAAGTGGGAGGAASTTVHLGLGDAGSNGGAGTTGAGGQGVAPGTTTPSNGGSGGQGAAGGAGSGGAGGALRGGGAATNPVVYDRYTVDFLRGLSLSLGGAGGAGGGAAGGDGVTGGRGGGGGGGGGSIAAIYALEIVTGGSTPASVISVKGGNGGTSNNGTGNCGGAGGGGGGGGGYLFLAYAKKTGSAVIDLLDASGGNGGSGANGAGTGLGGNGGAGGDGGRIRVVNVLTGVSLLTIGSAGSAGSAGSGTTGGAGGLGGASKVTL